MTCRRRVQALAITSGWSCFWIFSAGSIYPIPASPAASLLASGAVSFETAFSGFSQDTPWFLFGAIILGTDGGSKADSRGGLRIQ